MQFGLYVPTEGMFADVRLLAELARETEEAGWDGYFIWDELLSIVDDFEPISAAIGESGAVVDAFVALTAIAANTDRIRVGAMVTPLPRLRPESFAKQTATLDRFSGGRLTLGVGLGNPAVQFSAFGGITDARVRAAMVDEFLDLLTQLWSGREVDFHGAYYSAAGISMVPTPLQLPRIPIWIGADSGHRAPRRRAARWDGFIPASPSWPDGVITVDDYQTIIADIAAQRPTTSSFDVGLIGNAAGTLPTLESLKDYAAAGVTWILVQALTVDDAYDRARRGPPQGAP